MTIPDGYETDVPSVVKTIQNKAIGLSITVEVIAHLLYVLKEI
jgi:hypothetical protein